MEILKPPFGGKKSPLPHLATKLQREKRKGIYHDPPLKKNEHSSQRLLQSPLGDVDSPNASQGVQCISSADEIHLEAYGYKKSTWKTINCWFLIMLTGGFLRLIFHWAPHWMLLATHTLCPLNEATKVLLLERYKKYRNFFVHNIKNLKCSDIQYDCEYSALRSPHPTPKKNGTLPSKSKENKSNTSIYMSDSSTPENFYIPSASGECKDMREIRWFSHKKLTYIWDEEQETFYYLSGLDRGQTAESLHDNHGLSWKQQLQRRLIYGENWIKVPIQSIFKLLFLEVLNPFYIFQIFSVILWYSDNYMYYATVIVVTSVCSVVSEVYQMHSNEVRLNSTIQARDLVEVLRDNGEQVIIPSEHLAPGDIIIIPPEGCVMQCDAILLQGNTIVNESMLTGESVPVTKTPFVNIPGLIFDEKEHSRHTLYCGTKVIQTRYYGNELVKAVVIRTGFMTSKGLLIRSILYPPPVDFRFVQDTYKFIIFLAGIALLGLIYTVVTKAERGIAAGEIAFDSLDLITIVVPPALPMAMTIGILYALSRLKQRNMFCISPRSINIAGVLNCICFDKTGTLTEDGLDMKGVVEVDNENEKLTLGKLRDPLKISNKYFVYGMSTCHSITVIKKELVGDPLDLKMFSSTGWLLEEPGTNDNSKYDNMMPSVVRPAQQILSQNEEDMVEIGILRQFPFSSSLQRMSVITRKLGDSSFSLFSKGSPEMIASLSKPESLPSNFNEVLLGYTNEGYRVLALAWKPLKISYAKAQRIPREEVETELHFLGLLILENRIKEGTMEVIKELKNATIRTVMVTGDNMLTALSVGRECGIVDIESPVIMVKATSHTDNSTAKLTFEYASNGYVLKDEKNEKDYTSIIMNENYSFAIEGKSWAIMYSHFPEVLKKIAVRGVIFSRMNPEQKQQLILELQQLGYYVGMCGDGANDCGALKTAHAGISLSVEAEASVASPFTSQKATIGCVPALIQEGRAALVTSFGMFKYMATYSLTQFISIMILYSIDCNLTDLQFLYIDLFLITVFAFFFGKTESFKGDLGIQPPTHSLISIAPLASLVLHIIHILGFQLFNFYYIQDQPWFVPYNTSTVEEDYFGSHENYAVFCISQFQYIIIAIIYSKGPPYRRPIYTNYLLMGSLLVMTCSSIYITINPATWLSDQLELVLPPDQFFRWQIIILALCNSLVAIFVEIIFIDYVIVKIAKTKLKGMGRSKKKYMVIETDMKNDKSWPNISKYTERDDHFNEKNAGVSNCSSNVISIAQYHSSL